MRRLRSLQVIGCLVIASMLFTACAAPAGPGAAPAGEAAAPATDKTLNILYWQAPTILNTHQSTGTKDIDAAAVILEPLATYNEKDELVPYLAAEIPTVENGGVAADGTSVTWKLKEGLKWSDGSDVTADDIIFHLAVLRRPGDGMFDGVQVRQHRQNRQDRSADHQDHLERGNTLPL